MAEKIKYHHWGILRIRIFLRSFLLQSLMSYTLMQGLGFGLGMIPIAERLKLKGEHLKEFLKRHLNFFNSHPYFSVYAIGAISRMEYEGKAADEIEALKNMLMGPLGLFGDQVFWSRFKPLVLCMAITGLLFLPWPLKLGSRIITAGIILSAVIVYNIVHLAVKWRGSAWGLKCGVEVLRVITHSKMLKYRLHLSLAAAFTAGLFAVKAFELSEQSLIFMAAFAAGFLALRLKAPLWVTLLFVFAVSIALTLFLKITYYGSKFAS